MVASVNESTLLAFRVPRRSLAEQRTCATEFARLHTEGAELRGKLEQQIELLQEHRQALITAAVTGQLEVPGAA